MPGARPVKPELLAQMRPALRQYHRCELIKVTSQPARLPQQGIKNDGSTFCRVKSILAAR